MILDFVYNNKKKLFNISYITQSGAKALKSFNVQRFKSYRFDPDGAYVNWDGRRCSPIYKDGLKWEDWSEPLTFMNELPEHDRNDLLGKFNPRLYTWDIETYYDPQEFPEPNVAKFPVTVISVANDKLDVVELGTKDLSEEDQLWVQEQIIEYLNRSEFYRGLGLPTPKFRYMKFDAEEEMIEYFLKNIACKVPVLSGWNSDGFDHLYLQTRMAKNFDRLSWRMASPTFTTSNKTYQNMKGEKFRLQKPDHTLMVDMMDIIGTFDMTLDKESLTLDSIAKQAAGIGKVEYKGDLEHLRQTDYRRYVFYSCIDSLLVQLIDKKCRTLKILASQALYCKTKIEAAKSKIAISEAVIFNHFYDLGIKVVPEQKHPDRPELLGAYVRQPTAGKFNWVCCNDFSGLYPSNIATCNLSFENYIGSIRDGKFVEADLDRYRKDPNYVVSVNGCVYKNDKDYAFKQVQLKLRSNRNVAKYLSKSLRASVQADLEHIIAGKTVEFRSYNDQEIEKLSELGYKVKCSDDLYKIEDPEAMLRDLKFEIEYLVSFEQANKLIMNSLYGGSSHVAFFWFNIDIANDITAEGRNLIHLMEKHIPEWIDANWAKLTDVHKELGITLKKNFVHKNLIQLIAGDTDSCAGDTLIRTNKGQMPISELFEQSKIIGQTANGTLLAEPNIEVMNWSEERGVHFTRANYVSKHSVTKEKWRLKTKSGREVVVTGDHSLIVFRDGKQLEVKPRDILKTDKILTIKM